MKSNIIILFLVIIVIGLTGYGVAIMFGMSTDLFDQKNIKPLEIGSQTQLPLGSITTEGYENTTISKWFDWTGTDAKAKPGEIQVHNVTLDLKTGTQHYETYCQFCHGTGLKKNKWGLAATKMNEAGMLAPDLPSLTSFNDDQYLYLKIENGGTTMPRLGHIVIPETRRQIINYLRSIEIQQKEPGQDN